MRHARRDGGTPWDQKSRTTTGMRPNGQNGRSGREYGDEPLSRGLTPGISGGAPRRPLHAIV